MLCQASRSGCLVARLDDRPLGQVQAEVVHHHAGPATALPAGALDPLHRPEALINRYKGNAGLAEGMRIFYGTLPVPGTPRGAGGLRLS